MGSLNFIIVFKLISPRDEKWSLNHPTGQFPPAPHHIIRQTAAYSLCLLLRNRRIRLALPAALLPSLPPSLPPLSFTFYLFPKTSGPPAGHFIFDIFIKPAGSPLPPRVRSDSDPSRTGTAAGPSAISIPYCR